jgi:hypothetical protein
MKDSSLGRLLGVLLSPAETFRSIEARPTWAVPLLLLLLLGGVVGVLVQMKADPEEMVHAQIEKFKIDVPAEKVDKMVEDARNQSVAKKVAVVGFGLALQAVFYAFIAAVFLGLLRLFASEIDYVRSLSVTLHGYMPQGVAALLNVPLMLGRETVTFDEATKGGVLVSSLAALAPEGASPMLVALLGSVDLFSIWTAVLLALGFRIAGKVSTAVSTGIVVLLWLIYIGVKLGFTALFLR